MARVTSLSPSVLLASPMLISLLASLRLPGSDFLSDFERVFDRDGMWSSRRSSLQQLTKFDIRASWAGDNIVADATIAKRLYIDERRPIGLLRVPITVPESVRAAIIGERIAKVVEHALTMRADAIIRSVMEARDGSARVIAYEAPPVRLAL